jgi:hypothetical protein
MPELPRVDDTESGRTLGASTAAAELPPASDASLPIIIESDSVPPFTPVSNPGLYPGENTYPGEETYPGGPLQIDAANVAYGELPMAIDTETASTLTVVGERPVPAATEAQMALPLTVLVDDGVFASAIEDIDRTPVFTLKADWGRTGLFDHAFSDLTELVEDVTVDRTLTGELPPEVGLVDGTTSATMSVSLAGRWSRTDDDGLDPVDVFAPYRPDSPLFGQPILQSPIELETGFVTASGPRLDRRFTGTVASINPASAARTVEVTGLDPSHRLRESITLSGAAQYNDILTKRGPDAYRSRLNTQWVIDHVLRRNGIYTSPPPRPEAVLSVTGHGSMIPEIGWGGSPQEYYSTYRGPKWQTGAFGGALATVGGDIGRWWLEEQITAAAGAGFGFSMWLGMYPGDGVSRELFSLDLTTNASWFLRFTINPDGVPYIGMDNFTGAGFVDAAGPGGYTPPATPRWQFVGVHISFGVTSMTVRFRVGGASITKTVTLAARSNNWKPGLFINYNWRRPFHNFQLWRSFTPPGAGQWQGETWTPQAQLDPGVNELTGIPQIVGEDSMELIKEICAVEGSTFEFTEEGFPRFRTRIGDEARGDLSDITERVTADRNLADLVSTTDESSVRNIINVKTKTLTVSEWQDYYTSPSNDAFDVPGSSTSYFNVDLPTAAYELPPPLSTFGCRYDVGVHCYASAGGTGFVYFGSNEDWSDGAKQDKVKNYIRVMVINANFPDQWVNQGVQIRVVRLSPWKMQIIINNQNAHPIRFATMTKVEAGTGVSTPGEPALIIPARILEQGEEQLETYTDNTSVRLYGPSTYDVGSSAERWRQTPEGLRGLATSVLASTSRPVPVLEAVDVPHDPRRRLRDRVVIEDPDGLGEVAATVVGLTTTYSTSGAADRLTVRPIAPPGLGLIGDPTVGLLDVNLVLG